MLIFIRFWDVKMFYEKLRLCNCPAYKQDLKDDLPKWLKSAIYFIAYRNILTPKSGWRSYSSFFITTSLISLGDKNVGSTVS